MGTVLRAHDPGLSSLDVRVSGSAISVSLSIAAPDVALLADGGEADVRRQLSEMARDAVRLSVDGEALPPVIDEVAIDAGAARVRLSFALGQTRRQALRLSIASDVPTRVARGHRELMVVSVDDRVVAERLLDAESGPAAIDLEAASPSAAHAAWHYLELGVRHILSGLRPSGVSGRPAAGVAHRARAGSGAHGVHDRPLRVAGAGCDRRRSRTGVDRRAAHRRLDRVGRPGNPAARAARRPLARGLRLRADPRVRLRRGARSSWGSGLRRPRSRWRCSRSTPASRPASLRRRRPCCRSSGPSDRGRRGRPGWCRCVPC